MELRHTKLDGLSIRYARAARPSAPTLVLNGAWPQSILCWEPLWGALAEDFDVVAFDMPGFGASEGRSELMRPSAQAGFLIRFLDALGIERAGLVAVDVGVPMALFALARHPERFTRATLSGGAGGDFDALGPAVRLLARSAASRNLVAVSPALFVRIAHHQGLQRATVPASRMDDYLRCHSRPRLRSMLEYLASYPVELPALDRELSNVRAPSTLFWGQSDGYIPPRNAHAIAARLAQADIRIVPGAGHFAHDDASGELLAHLRESFARPHAH